MDNIDDQWQKKSAELIEQFYESCSSCFNSALSRLDKGSAADLTYLFNRCADKDKKLLSVKLVVTKEGDYQIISRISNRLLSHFDNFKECPVDLMTYILEVSDLFVQNLGLEKLIRED